jgi:hypothetical protein
MAVMRYNFLSFTAKKDKNMPKLVTPLSELKIKKRQTHR